MKLLDPMVRIMDGVLVRQANTDLAQPLPYYGQGDPTATATVPPPVDENDTVQEIAAALLAVYTLDQLAHVLAAIVPGVSLDVWRGMVGRVRGHRATPPTLPFERGTQIAKVAKAGAHREIYYRAAYLLNGAKRVQHDVAHGDSIEEALDHEKTHYAAHQQARAGRLVAARSVGQAAELHGDLLGWYLDPLLNNEAECIAANGNNFYASESTIIGDPGAVHRWCGCTAGPPYEGAGLVNDAIAASRTVTVAGATHRLRRVS